MHMRTLLAGLLVVAIPPISSAADVLKWVKKPVLQREGQTWTVQFELDSLTDVEVAIIDAESSKVVRHLAAGVLGPQAPPPLVKNSRAQKIAWDGRDDYGNPVRNPSLMAVRVRAGMSVSLAQIVGGDPYAYYSEEMGDNDHSPWAINGVVAKGDGNVYVWGHSSNLGPPALRQYSVNGDYRRTLFPMPAGMDVNRMKGWGLNLRPDGTYTPRFNALVDPSLTETFLDTNLRMARLLPTPASDRLVFCRTGMKAGLFELLEMQSDGTIAAEPSERLLGPLVKQPPFLTGPIKPNSHIVHSHLGPIFFHYAADNQTIFLSGLYSATTRYGTLLEAKTDGFWRDGQVWKINRKTRTATVFFTLDNTTIPTTRKDRAAAYGGSDSYAALHGVAADGDGHVFVCDRLNKRLLVLDPRGQITREISMPHLDAIALGKRPGVLYATTRVGDFHRRGTVHLHKFNDWRKDEAPAETIEVSKTGFTRKHKHSYVVVCETEQGSNIWVGLSQMPIRIYRDAGQRLKLLKDFYRVEGAQRCLGFDRLQVDPRTEEVYLLDAHDTVWKIADWKQPRFVKIPLRTASIGIDARRRHIYVRTLFDGGSSNSIGKIARFHLDREDYPPANFGNSETNRATEKMRYEWCFEGNSDKGIAIAPNGNLAVAGMPSDGLRFFAGQEDRVPWKGTKIADLPFNAGGVRFDLAGNLYVGYVDKKPAAPLPGFEGDRFAAAMGRIYKYAPTGSLESGNLFPTPPAGPVQTYDVPYGAFQTACVTRSPRFGVDGYGRIYYPTNIAARVSVMDNAGNEILHFGTYGNQDSLGGLPGELVPTSGIPLAFPNSVDATDDYIYVADMVNLRVLRLKKDFRAVATSPR